MIKPIQEKKPIQKKKPTKIERKLKINQHVLKNFLKLGLSRFRPPENLILMHTPIRPKSSAPANPRDTLKPPHTTPTTLNGGGQQLKVGKSTESTCSQFHGAPE